MHLKSFTFGMGTSIIILSLIFFIALELSDLNSEPILYSEYEIIDMAIELGMVFPQQEVIPPMDINPDSEEVDDVTKYLDEDELIYNTEVTIFINSGTPAIDISQILYSEGIINDANSFSQYLIEKEFSNRLRAGTLTFKLNSSFEEATSVLIGRELFPHEL